MFDMAFSPLMNLSRAPLVSVLTAALVLPLGVVRSQEKNRFNLSEEKPQPRFEIKDPQWPAEVGEADICLWKDDKIAAVSLGVDDNFGTEIDWWKDKARQYDFKVTWFVIAGAVGANKGTGYWEQFRELDALGHGVESHTVSHLHIEEPGWGGPEWDFTKSKKAARETPALPPPDEARIKSGIEWEYADSKALIEKNIPGKSVSALAYPGGKNTKFNDREVAAKHYRVARGAWGKPNIANQIDYLSTAAMSSWHFGEQEYGWSNIRNILDKSLYRGMFYRAWVILFAHGVSANPPLFDKTFEFLKENRDKLWIGLYVDVAKYGQERDTATLKVESKSAERITFQLTDEMDDSYFNYPLTVKVRIPNEWKETQALQGEKPVEVSTITHEGNAYALVQAVPDAGLITLSPKTNE